jgi:site-specific DNA-methyltransferase (adenine-specific)
MRIERIGDVTLYLGDCMEILPQLGGVSAVVTDPPYGMEFRSNSRIERYAKISNDQNAECLVWATEIEATHSKYIFCRWDNIPQVPKPKSMITWVKNNWSMGDLEHEHGRQTEVALFYPGADHRFPKKRPADVISAARTNNEHHPTEKPVGLIQTVIEWTVGAVVDPFMGSGTTGVACAQLRRPFVGIEIDEIHFDTARRRIEAAYRQPGLFAATIQPRFEQEALF